MNIVDIRFVSRSVVIVSKYCKHDITLQSCQSLLRSASGTLECHRTKYCEYERNTMVVHLSVISLLLFMVLQTSVHADVNSVDSKVMQPESNHGSRSHEAFARSFAQAHSRDTSMHIGQDNTPIYYSMYWQRYIDSLSNLNSGDDSMKASMAPMPEAREAQMRSDNASNMEPASTNSMSSRPAETLEPADEPFVENRPMASRRHEARKGMQAKSTPEPDTGRAMESQSEMIPDTSKEDSMTMQDDDGETSEENSIKSQTEMSQEPGNATSMDTRRDKMPRSRKGDPMGTQEGASSRHSNKESMGVRSKMMGEPDRARVDQSPEPETRAAKSAKSGMMKEPENSPAMVDHDNQMSMDAKQKETTETEHGDTMRKHLDPSPHFHAGNSMSEPAAVTPEPVEMETRRKKMAKSGNSMMETGSSSGKPMETRPEMSLEPVRSSGMDEAKEKSKSMEMRSASKKEEITASTMQNNRKYSTSSQAQPEPSNDSSMDSPSSITSKQPNGSNMRMLSQPTAEPSSGDAESTLIKTSSEETSDKASGVPSDGEGSSDGAIMHVELGSAPPPHSVWTAGPCWHWNKYEAPKSFNGKLDAAFCRTVRVPKKSVYYIIPKTVAPPEYSSAIGIVRLFQGKKVLLWKKYYYEHEKSSHEPIKKTMTPGVDYTVCFTGKDHSFDFCGIDMYACQTKGSCASELKHHSVLSLSRRSR